MHGTMTVADRCSRPARMTVLALLAAGALGLAGCATGQGASPTPTAPSSSTPTTGEQGADPVPLEPEQLAAISVETLGGTPAILRWIEPGTSLAVFVGGSSTEGCVPEPGPAELSADDALRIPFTQPDGEGACTADFTVHGWQLALPRSIDVSAPLPVELVDMPTAGESTEVEVEVTPLPTGVQPDPQPSVIDPPSGGAADPEAVPEGEVPPIEGGDDGQPPVAAHWIEPGTSFLAVLSGSGTPSCVPEPIAATVTGPGAIEVRFQPATGTMCTADLHYYGWRFTLPEPVSATLDVEVSFVGLEDGAAPVQATITPDDVLEP